MMELTGANRARKIASKAGIGILAAIPAVALWATIQTITPGVALFLTFFPAIVAAGALSGRIAGGTAALVGLAAVDFGWFIHPLGGTLSTPQAALDNALFLVSVVIILWVTYSLRSERDRCEAYFNVAGNCLMIVGSDGYVRQVNRHGVAILGYPSEADLVGKDWFETCIPDRLRPQARAAFQEALTDKLPHERDSVIVRPDGSERHIQWHFVALKHPNREMNGLLASGVDITELRQTLDALAWNEARLSAVLRQFPGAVAILERPHGKIVARSDRSSEILGHTALDLEAIEGLARYGGLHDDGRRYAPEEYPIARALISGEEVKGEMLRYKRPNETVVDLEVYASPIRDERQEIVAAVGIALDVSKRVQAERELRRREESLSDALAAREMLIREADHRIKNSLQMVISMLVMQKKTAPDPSVADSIASAIARVGAISEAHFALQKSDDFHHVDFGAMLKEVTSRLASLRQETFVDCILEGDLTLSADQAIPAALMVSELLTNSLRHAYPPGARGNIVVNVKNAAGVLIVTVADDGVGIPEASKRRTGLGSRLIDMFAHQVGGIIVVSSPPEGGTVASLTLPIGIA